MTDLLPRTGGPARAPGRAGRDRIHCEGLVRIYKRAEVEVVALQGLDLTVRAGELIALVGASGSGKSTLLNILSGLDQPTAGRVEVAGADLTSMGARGRRRFRRRTCGFVWQQAGSNLFGFLTAEENVALPQRLAGVARKQRTQRAGELLELLGVGECATRRPAELSGGQAQRVSIAVAVANGPEVLLCDEPTGELDSATASEVFAALRTITTELGSTCVVVTHDSSVTREVERTVAIRDGRTATETLRRVAADAGESPPEPVEYAVLDRVGRLQLPEKFVEALGLRHRVRVELEADHIGIWPADDASDDASDDADVGSGE